MAERARRPTGGKYETRMVKREYDDNPKFSSAFRMASPAPAGHFLRVFGQTARNELRQFTGSNAHVARLFGKPQHPHR